MPTSAARTTRRVNNAISAALLREQNQQPLEMRHAERARMVEHELARLREQLLAAQHRIAELERENDRLAARNMIANSKSRAAALVEASTNAPVGSQVDYARRWNQEQYSVSRWVASGKLRTVQIGRRRMVYLDQPPPPKKR
jgi:hypothetical protein